MDVKIILLLSDIHAEGMLFYYPRTSVAQCGVCGNRSYSCVSKTRYW